jgi:hypothetical protein
MLIRVFGSVISSGYERGEAVALNALCPMAVTGFDSI